MMSLFKKDDHGQTAPNHMKTARLRSISIVGWSESSMVSSRNQSLRLLIFVSMAIARITYSCVKTLPAIKHARRSSVPIRPQVPTTKS